MAPPTMVLVCKRPRLGQGKQRLANTIGIEAAFQISSLLLDCASDLLQAWTGPKVLSPAHAEDVDWAHGLLPDALVVVQTQGNLGVRIQEVDRCLREMGHDRLLWVGSDCPSLTLSDLHKAQQALDSGASFHFRAARDGGAVLMANAQPWPGIEDLAWSTDRFLETALQLCSATASTTVNRDTLPDLDLLEDIPAVLGSISNPPSGPKWELESLLRAIHP